MSTFMQVLAIHLKHKLLVYQIGPIFFNIIIAIGALATLCSLPYSVCLSVATRDVHPLAMFTM